MAAGGGAGAVTARTKLRRHPERRVRGREELHAILDAALVCHVGVLDGGMPVVIPTVFGRSGNTLYLHGSSVSRLVAAAAGPICVTVTLVDGIVMSRSAFGHSMNYRSVMVFGDGRLVTDPTERREALRVVTEHLVPGRWDEIRQPSDEELAITGVVALRLDEASAKARSGPPRDTTRDRALPQWAGVLPLARTVGAPIPDEGCEDVPVPPSVAGWSAPGGVES